MKAIEFVTVIKNGKIEVPKEHLGILETSCRVIILLENESESRNVSFKKPKRFKALSVKTKGFVFDRNKANER